MKEKWRRKEVKELMKTKAQIVLCVNKPILKAGLEPAPE